METLALKLAEILEISIESAIELYPLIKSQFVSYNVLNMISGVVIIPIIVSCISLFVLGIIFIVETTSPWTDNDILKELKKLIKLSSVVFAIAMLIYSTSEILKYILATDFMLIKTFLN